VNTFGGRTGFSREKASRWYRWRRSRWLDKECAKLSGQRKQVELLWLYRARKINRRNLNGLKDATPVDAVLGMALTARYRSLPCRRNSHIFWDLPIS